MKIKFKYEIEICRLTVVQFKIELHTHLKVVSLKVCQVILFKFFDALARKIFEEQRHRHLLMFPVIK